MGRCRACGASIEWVTSAARRRPMPLDADPTLDGNGLVTDDLAHVLGPLDVAALDDDQRARLRMPHHATCPNWGR